MPATANRLILIGASAGGVSALLELCGALPRFFPAPICVVQHVGNLPSILPELIRTKGPNHAMHAEEGMRVSSGTIYLAPPDRHMLLEGNVLTLSRGPKENHARPAIDPLFRSAALHWGERVIGVVLTGQMDDGTAGLADIKACGGIAIVQDPLTAQEPEMPASALRHVDVDHCVPLAQIAPLLVRLTGQSAAAAQRSVPARIPREHAMTQGGSSVEQLAPISVPSSLTCPDCGGSLWELKDTRPLRYRCHVGHAYSVLSLANAQSQAAEQSLWAAVRSLREREMLLRRAAEVALATGDTEQARAAVTHADTLRERVAAMTEMAETGAEESQAPNA